MTRPKFIKPDAEAEWEYAAEGRAFHSYGENDLFRTLKDATEWVNATLASDWWKERGFPTDIRIRGQRHSEVSHYSERGIISLARIGMGFNYMKVMVLHELAHFICHKIPPYDHGHGKAFMFRLLQLIEHYISDDEAKRLEYEFNRTPEDVEAEAAQRKEKAEAARRDFDPSRYTYISLWDETHKKRKRKK